MPSVKTTSLPIDRDSVEELKEKLLGLQVENENDESPKNNEFFEDEDANNDEETENSNGRDTFPEVAILLEGMGMKKYTDIFKKESIDLSTFLNLTEHDLEELGISNKTDIENIMTSLGEHKDPSANGFIIAENHSDDYQIVKNIQNNFLLIQSYCALIECHLKKTELIDYNITSKETAKLFFTKFARVAIKQCELINNLLFQQDSYNHLIGKILKANNLVLPDDLKEKLTVKKIKKKKNSNYVVGFVGLSVVLIFAAAKLLKRIIH